MERGEQRDIPDWVEPLIIDVALVGAKYSVLQEKYKRARGVIQKWLNDPRVKERIRAKREAYESEVADKLRLLTDMSLDFMVDVMSKPAVLPQDRMTQARIALSVLSGRGHLTQKQEVAHTGGVTIFVPRKVPVGHRRDGGNDIDPALEAPAEADVRPGEA